MSNEKVDVSEIQKCAKCGRGMMHRGDVHFYEVELTQCIIDQRAVQQLHGMEVMMGAAAPLALVLSPVRHVAIRMPPVKIMVCATCAGAPTSVYELWSPSDE